MSEISDVAIDIVAKEYYNLAPLATGQKYEDLSEDFKNQTYKPSARRLIASFLATREPVASAQQPVELTEDLRDIWEAFNLAESFCARDPKVDFDTHHKIVHGLNDLSKIIERRSVTKRESVAVSRKLASQILHMTVNMQNEGKSDEETITAIINQIEGGGSK